MKILVTGVAGFIGYHMAKKLIANGHDVTGLDNLNDYYDIQLKFARLNELGITKKMAQRKNIMVDSDSTPKNFRFIRLDLEDKCALQKLFEDGGFDKVCNLAAQAGVRYSLENPEAYVNSNVVGFLNILECCKQYGTNHLVYASSSSVYGMNKKVPFETSDPVDHPISLYAATKKSNELMAFTYSHLYKLRTTGLRFFTVYGPWGRPDMALFLFTKAILKGNPIKVFNHGNMERDFTYIADVVEGMFRILEKNESHFKDLYKVYNIGNNKPIKLLDFIKAIELGLGIKAKKEMLPMQPGDVSKTWANVDGLIEDFGYSPDTSVKEGVLKFVEWYKEYYNIPL